MGALIDMEQKGCDLIIHDHDHDLWVTMLGGWLYQTVTGVTSDVGVPSTYLVGIFFFNLMRVNISEESLAEQKAPGLP